MYSTPLDQALAAMPPLTDEQRRALLSAPHLTTLAAAFACVPDFRQRRGRRYPLVYLLICLVIGLLAGCDSTHALEQWCREHRDWLAHWFPEQRHLTPSGALYRRFLPRLSVEHLEWALAGWVRATRPAKDTEAVALDGKAVRGAAAPGQPAPHLLTVYTHDSQETLIQVRVADKTNEIPVAQALLPLLPLRGRVLTADALHTQVAFLTGAVAQGGDVVLTVKANQPALYADLAVSFADPHTP